MLFSSSTYRFLQFSFARSFRNMSRVSTNVGEICTKGDLLFELGNMQIECIVQ